MKHASRIAIRLGFVLLLLSSSFADDQQDAAALLKKAADAVDIFSLGPFQLTGHIKSDFLGKTADGTYRLDWISSEKWREELNLGGYTEIRIGLGGQVYRSRNIDFMPPPVMEFRRLLAFSDPARLLPGEEAGNLTQKKESDIAVSCIDITKSQRRMRTVCLDTTSGAMVKASDGVTYADFRKVGEKVFPYIWDDDYKPNRLTVTVENLVQIPPADAARFVPSKDFIPRTGCFAPSIPKIDYKVTPKYPQPERQRNISGVVYFYSVIAPDGKIAILRAFPGANKDFEAAAIDAVKQWTFTPAVCNATPVEYEYVSTVRFQMSPPSLRP